ILVNIDYYDDARNIELIAQTNLGKNIISAFSN
ncbi:TPA: tRNA (adenosine(37)-N6)-threonylcarbamoyltransferase complex ATPase subunit type 1 TsaE, partial [Haemophilus influenzae]